MEHISPRHLGSDRQFGSFANGDVRKLTHRSTTAKPLDEQRDQIAAPPILRSTTTAA
jgi:hypothetical protein